MTDNRYYAVLTGDVVGSRRLGAKERQRLLAALTEAGEELQGRYSQSVPYTPEIFRGDGWQFLTTDPAGSLRQGLYYRSLVKAKMGSTHIDTRFCLGLGSINFLPPEGPSAGAGQAFNLSGQGLDEMEKQTYLAIQFPPEFDPDMAISLRAIGWLIDRLAQGWTGRQALAVSGALLDLTQTRIAEETFDGQVTQQAVAQHLASAGWAALQFGLVAFEAVLPHHLPQ
jgi:hypothetical protein